MNTPEITGPGFSSLHKVKKAAEVLELPQIRRATADDARFRINRLKKMGPNFANPGADEDKSDYQGFYEQFVECKELGVHENFIDGVEIAEPMKGYSSELGDVMISLKEYIIYMKESQNEIDYITDEFLIPECLLDVFPEIAEKNDDHKKFYEQLIECTKPGVHENFVDGFVIAELLRFNTSKSEDEQINLKAYVTTRRTARTKITTSLARFSSKSA